MNNLITLLSLLNGGRNQRFFNILGNRRRNNGNMVFWSILGFTVLGVIGSRNTRWMQKLQEGFGSVRNNTRIPLQNQFNFANEFAEEIAPSPMNKSNK